MAQQVKNRLITDPEDMRRLGVHVRTRYVPRIDFVLIKRIGEELAVTAGGIHIPDEAKAQSNKGRVIAVGEGRYVGDKLIETGLVVGDIVVFSKYGGEEIVLDGDNLLLVRADEVKLIERSVADVSV
jgi:chaperonin GroES